VNVHGNDEIGQLGEAFNHMTVRLREALSLNEEENEKLTSVLSNMSDGVIATDERGIVIVLNRRAMQMLRVDDSAVGEDVGKLLHLSPDQVRQYMADQEQTVIISLEMPDNGEEPLIVRVTFTPVHRRGQGITGVIAVLQDVTEQEKMEKSRREFVANVSHELRTPLTTIKSYAEALEDGAADDLQLRQRFIGVIRNETERMIRLVTDLLHLSRLDSKQAILRKLVTDMAEMLEDVVDRFSFQMRQKSIRHRVIVDKGVPPVALDRDQIDQVLDNLVSNAIKYTPDGGFIEIRACLAGPDTVQISIQDNGIGIPKKDLGRIFERFYRVDKARSRSMGGTGLGLSIAREIIKAHGGSIEIDSEVNKGTKVTFTLPVRAEGSEAS
jgi:two-component system sensor histidine kinase VicK